MNQRCELIKTSWTVVLFCIAVLTLLISVANVEINVCLKNVNKMCCSVTSWWQTVYKLVYSPTKISVVCVASKCCQVKWWSDWKNVTNDERKSELPDYYDLFHSITNYVMLVSSEKVLPIMLVSVNQCYQKLITTYSITNFVLIVVLVKTSVTKSN